jgi:hypothetical protein
VKHSRGAHHSQGLLTARRVPFSSQGVKEISMAKMHSLGEAAPLSFPKKNSYSLLAKGNSMHSTLPFKDHTVASMSFSSAVHAPCCSRLQLADRNNSPVPPSQTLGVLFFPLSPPSRKGATHNQRVLAPQLASKAELPLTMS